MLIFSELLEEPVTAQFRVALSFHERIKGRLRITTTEGVDAGIQIDRGQTLNHGQLIQSESGEVLEVLAKDESVSVATTGSPLLFARACYHVGNRHAEVQIGDQKLIYLHDHVMDEMLVQLGLEVNAQQLPFQPENGAYSAGGHSHAHDHDHAHHHHEH